MKQIIFLYPDAYNLSWDACKSLKNELELHISLPVSENPAKIPVLEERKAYFKRCLTQFVSKFHEEHLKTQGKSEKIAENLRKHRVWDQNFLLEEVPEIPEGCLPRKNFVGVKSQSLGDFLKNRGEKSKENADLLRIIKETQRNCEGNEGVSKKMGISQKLLEKVRFL